MGMALSMASVLSHHALEVFDLIGQDPDVECAKKILEWITGNDLRVFTQRDCHVRFKGSYPKISDLKPGLDILTERQIIREKINKKEGAGRPSVAFEVNPKI